MFLLKRRSKRRWPNRQRLPSYMGLVQPATFRFESATVGAFEHEQMMCKMFPWLTHQGHMYRQCLPLSFPLPKRICIATSLNLNIQPQLLLNLWSSSSILPWAKAQRAGSLPSLESLLDFRTIALRAKAFRATSWSNGVNSRLVEAGKKGKKTRPQITM